MRHLIPTLAQGTAQRLNKEYELEDYTHERNRLQRPVGGRGSVALVTREVEEEETQARINKMTPLRAGVLAHKATHSA